MAVFIGAVKRKLLASANTLEKSLEQISNYYYSPNIKLIKVAENEWEIHNSKGKINSVTLTFKKGKYKFEQI
jgi:hypothetical protein